MRNNSSRTSLFLMELIIAIFFFSLAGAVCIQLFVRSHVISNSSVELNYSVLWAQNVAEAFCGCNGNIDRMTDLLEDSFIQNDHDMQTLILLFDEDFHSVNSKPQMTDSAAYRLTADIVKEGDLLACYIAVENTKNAETSDPLYTLTVSLFPDKEADNEQ